MNISYYLPRLLRLSVEHAAWEGRNVNHPRIYYSDGVRWLLAEGAKSARIISADNTTFLKQLYRCPLCGIERGMPECIPCRKGRNDVR